LKHIVSFSGGKDSTAMLLMMIERERESDCKQYPIDEIIFCDTGKEFPALYRHIDKIEEYIGRPITRLTYKDSFDYLMFEHIKTKGKHQGKCGYGWPDTKARWCTDRFKQLTMTKYLKEKYDNNYIEYVGIAYDEFKRYKKTQNGHKKYPLIEWKITEGMALKYCYDKGFDWEGLYTHFERVSCWCCPLKNQRELYMLYSFYPELWAELKDMDSRAWNQFKRDYSVQDLENMFKEWLDKVKI
jgi:3'-phosphoadenosine 5'-phosphosulfate sulfotransferase (PAPS reductase)/FAD synthetase